MKKFKKFVTNNSLLIVIISILLIIPAYIGYKNTRVNYDILVYLPSDIETIKGENILTDEFGLGSYAFVIEKNMGNNKILKLEDKIRDIENVNEVISASDILDTIPYEMLPSEVSDKIYKDNYTIMMVTFDGGTSEDTTINAVRELRSVVGDANIVKKYDKNGIVAGEGPLMKDLVNISDHDFKMVNYTSILVIFIIMILVLKSISLPIILILLLEIAIFANMAFAYYMGDALPFIASIVVGTVQLGATIDYAILMSTKYLEERTMNKKKEALVNTLKVTVPSIITSALCFFAATFGVAVYTKIDMIGSICELLARGAIISMIAVIFVLPALFMIFDKFIIRFTKMKKESV